jgi:hypothetical protein
VNVVHIYPEARGSIDPECNGLVSTAMNVGMVLLLLSTGHLGCLSRTHMPVCEVLSETELSDEEETY